jgi:predicted ArsR family transcriptional regulator
MTATLQRPRKPVIPGETVLSGACLRVLLAVCQECDATGRGATIRGVMVRLGVTENAIGQQLPKLRDAGLVEWEDGRAGTLRPRCTIALWRDA